MNDRIEDISIESLFLDDENPRLPSYLRGKDDKTIITYMLQEAATLELMLAIGQKGFFRGEPLLVVEEEGKFRVIEGNRRLTALLLLKNPSLAPIRQRKIEAILEEVQYRGDAVSKIPCQVFESAAPIYEYLGYRHITGIQAWDLTQKAAFLTRRWLDSFPKLKVDEASRELAKAIGSRKDYVKRLLVGFQVFQTIRDHDYFGVEGLSESTFFFNYIADSLNRANIAAFLGVRLVDEEPASGLSIPALKDWTHWFFEKTSDNQTRIKATAEELSMLNAVIANEKAFKSFKSGDKRLKDAYELTEEMDTLFVASIARAIDSNMSSLCDRPRGTNKA